MPHPAVRGVTTIAAASFQHINAMIDFLRFRIFPLLFVGVLGFGACDANLTDNATDDLAAASFAGFSATLSEQLGLTNDQQQTLRTTFAQYESRDPGTLWRVAANLQATLTDEQKERLLSQDGAFRGPNGPGQGFRSNGPRQGFRGRRGGPRGGPGMGGRGMGSRPFPSGGLLFDVLTDAQKAQFEELHATFRAQVQPLVETRRDGTLSPADFRTQVSVLHDELRASVDALLTEEQRTELDQRRTERRQGRQASRAERQAEARAIRDEVLRLDAAASDAFDAAIEAHRADVWALIEAARADGTDRVALRAAVAERRADHVASLGGFLSETQVEIVQIHNALMRRGGKGRGFGGPGFGLGGPNGQRGRGFGPGGFGW